MIAAHAGDRHRIGAEQAINANLQKYGSRYSIGQKSASASPSVLTLVAHDLRSPLATLRSLVELIEVYQKADRPEKIASCATRASNIIDSLEEMLNSILERVMKTGDPLNFEPFPLSIDEILNRVITNNSPAAEIDKISLRQQSCGSFEVEGDYQLLYQAIENMIGNAITHSSAGMAVDCTLRQSAGNVVLSIQDHGTGLSCADIQKAFKPFMTLSSKPVGASKSWGLGLWIVKLIIEQHGGTVSVASEGLGKGTIFTVTLPLLAD